MSDRQLTANSPGERLYNGLIKENPTFVLMLGMCPTLAVTTSAVNGLGMGLTTAAVLTMSNLIISLLRNIIPNRVRIPAFIVIIASFVTVVQLLLEAYLPILNKSLGVYIPLIVVNCIILGRAESYAYSHGQVASLFDGLGMGLGFSFALTCIGAVREILGAGKLFGAAILPAGYTPISIFGLAPGAFFVLAALTAFMNFLKNRKGKIREAGEKLPDGCAHDCTACEVSGCGSHGKFYDAAVKKAAEKAADPKEVVKKDAEKTAAKEEAVKKAAEKAAAPKEAVKTEAKKAADLKETAKKEAGKKNREKQTEDDLEIIDMEEGE